MQNQSQYHVNNEKVEAMFNDICQLKVAELRALQDMLVSRLSLKIVAPLSQIVDDIAVQKEAFEVLVESAGDLNKVAAIKAVKDLKSLGLMEAKNEMDKPFPWSLGMFDTDTEAQAVVALWSDKGFTVSVK